jgi:hypothetical protein
MLLIVKRAGRTVSEFRFARGPIYIGRGAQSQVFLPDRTVSRHHAVIYSKQINQWLIEDLDSANKTFLNDGIIKRAAIKAGDHVRIDDFDIEIELELDVDVEADIYPPEVPPPDMQRPTPSPAVPVRGVVSREIYEEQGSDIVLPTRRIIDFLTAADAISKSTGSAQLLDTLMDILLKQFDAYRIWCALRTFPEGPITAYAGRNRDGLDVELDQIGLREKIIQAMDEEKFVLIPQFISKVNERKIRSVMIAPIIKPDGCFGVLYVENTTDQAHYQLDDLDYLMLLAIYSATLVGHF